MYVFVNNTNNNNINNFEFNSLFLAFNTSAIGAIADIGAHCQ
jgi:hypothetical protein